MLYLFFFVGPQLPIQSHFKVILKVFFFLSQCFYQNLNEPTPYIFLKLLPFIFVRRQAFLLTKCSSYRLSEMQTYKIIIFIIYNWVNLLHFSFLNVFLSLTIFSNSRVKKKKIHLFQTPFFFGVYIC